MMEQMVKREQLRNLGHARDTRTYRVLVSLKSFKTQTIEKKLV